ncbi:Hypp3735 [Branchiostoma lanceolatum]|uniref:nicotinamidase n=1 Tax=Branchiostoma lanceolatum TaxID=7740 RepID=A0A8K0A2H2_BRALA|nr:Hypp3735 [Branchiostoma lanceolatum]
MDHSIAVHIPQSQEGVARCLATAQLGRRSRETLLTQSIGAGAAADMGEAQTPSFERYRKTEVFRKPTAENLKECELCFGAFDKDRDGFLNNKEFHDLCGELVSNSKKAYNLSIEQTDRIFKLLDTNKVLDCKSALIVVDMQNDFIEGSLAVRNCPAHEDGSAIIPTINRLLESVPFDAVVYTADWHPADHCSFVDNVQLREIHETSKIKADNAQVMDTVVFARPDKFEQKLWPAHCVQDSHGAELHPDLKVVKDHILIRKGLDPDVDSYSAFWDNMKKSSTPLVSELAKRHITDVYICGIATDVCVEFTSMDAIEHGFRTVLIEDACCGVSEEGIKETKTKLKKAGAILVQSAEVPDLVDCQDRPPQLAYQAAVNVAMATKAARSMDNIHNDMT